MKRSAIFSLLILLLLGGSEATFGREGCQFNIVGTWKAADAANPVLYHFTPDGTLTVISQTGAGRDAASKVIASAAYQLDDPQAPKSIKLTATDEGTVFAKGASTLEIVKYDDASFTCVWPGKEPTRWVRVDPDRYFIVFAARSGVFFDKSGPAFPMVIKVHGDEMRVNAVGTYSADGKRTFGPVPPDTYKDYLRDQRNDSEVMLRLEINSAQYARSLGILQEWERRSQENALLYPSRTHLNNVLLVKTVAETLNQCSEAVKLYKLNYLYPEDWISDKHAPPFLPFQYFKELRRLNESQHVRDEAFPRPTVSTLRPERMP